MDWGYENIDWENENWKNEDEDWKMQLKSYRKMIAEMLEGKSIRDLEFICT